MHLIGDLFQVFHEIQLAVLAIDIAKEVILIDFVCKLVKEYFFFECWIQVVE